VKKLLPEWCCGNLQSPRREVAAVSVLLLIPSAVAFAGFAPNVRIDHAIMAVGPVIAAGPALGREQPVYVAFESDGMNIGFQMSRDAGATWLTEDRTICQGVSPEVVADADGSVYIFYGDSGHVNCVRTTDDGATWSPATRVDDGNTGQADGARVAFDGAGNVVCVWSDKRTGHWRARSSVSTDHGAKWSPSVCVHNDVMPYDCGGDDVFVQPGTNHYFVTGTEPYEVRPGLISSHSFLYRSTDGGQSFGPGVQLDTFDKYCAHPHVVADSGHVICDYSGSTQTSGVQIFTESRTLWTATDSLGPSTPVTDLDTDYISYYCGNLAISADARVYTALMISPIYGYHHVYYAASSDYGASWSAREQVDDDSSDKQYPDIAADADGHVYLVWIDGREGLWFSTNNPAAIADEQRQRGVWRPSAAIVRRLSPGTTVYDAMGRRVVDPKPGIYFLRTEAAAAPRKVLLVE
jgi:hypothetical protein